MPKFVPSVQLKMANKNKARRLCRRRWILKQFTGGGRMRAGDLWVEFCSLFPKEAVTARQFRQDVQDLRETSVLCPYCKQQMTGGRVLRDD